MKNCARIVILIVCMLLHTVIDIRLEILLQNLGNKMLSWGMMLKKLLLLRLINILKIENQKECIKIFMLGFHVLSVRNYNIAIITAVQWTQVVKNHLISNICQSHPNNLLTIAYKLFMCLAILWDQVLPGYADLQIFLATSESLL